ncbi:hypothetical protein LH29_10510 [Draconibacterium sediminis]|uniref:Right handed beta helix domain-containing protein n=2 Tax=Draconibacterium sediminis TaxID=1544798 RepID=A0A0D8JCL8_9BACT|nr:hypothetical protein LH29_10510 [Draconibacterium sediminis]
MNNKMKRSSSISNLFVRTIPCLTIFLIFSVQSFATDLIGVNDAIVNLTVANSPYMITGDVTFNGELNIDPGVVVEFAGDFSFQVNGSIDARGTDTNPIIFRSATSDYQGYIKLNPTVSLYPDLYRISNWEVSKLTDGVTVLNDYILSDFDVSECVRGVVIGWYSSINLENFTIHDIQKYGIYCSYANSNSSTINITGGEIYNCGNYPDFNYAAAYFYYDGYSSAYTMNLNIENLKVHDNIYYGIYFRKGSGTFNANIK